MEESIEDQIQKRLQELPEDVQAAINSADLGQKLQAIGHKHSLHLDQIEKVGDETMLVMLGFVKPEDFVASLGAQAHLNPEQASAVATDINNDILLSIRESLKNFSPQQAAPSSTAPAAAIPTPPANPPAAPAPQSHPADMMLSQKTVTMPPQAASTPAPLPQKPTGYKADPYREPPIP